jgi:putative mRNA 3-end processing factor
VRLPSIDRVPPRARRVGNGRALVIAPPSVMGGSWLKMFGESNVAMASGWMLLRGVRRRRGFDRGFVVSDHADFPGLVAAVEASGARRVLATHGFADAFARFLRDRGLDASVLPTRFIGESAPDTTADDTANEHDDTTPEDDGADDDVDPAPA